MSDMPRWLERELTIQLAPVSAPESLWRRVAEARVPRRRSRPPDRVFWPAMAAMALLTLFALLRVPRHNRPDGNALTEQELAAVAENLDGGQAAFEFAPESFGEARAWARAKAGVDIELPPGPPADPDAVRLLGIRSVRFSGARGVGIDYRAGGEVATLVVSGTPDAAEDGGDAGKHLFSGTKATGKRRVFSWSMRHRTYTIAFSAEANPTAACMLCHPNVPGVMVFGLR